MAETSDPKRELQNIDAALAAVDKLRGALPDEQIEALKAPLLVQRNLLVNQSGGVNIGGASHVTVGRDMAGRDIVHVAITQTTPTPAPLPAPESLRAAYLNRVLEAASQLSLAGIDPKAASESGARLNLGAVYTALLTHTPEAAGRDIPPERLEAPDRDRQERRLSALEMLNREPHLVLLGDPGSGKSTFVNFVAMCLAGEALGRAEANLALLTAPLPEDEDKTRRLLRKEAEPPQPQPWDHGALLPVRVILRDFAARGLPEAGQRATADHLWRFITAELEAAVLSDYAHHLRGTLMERGGLVLLDGLDEAPEAEQRRAQIRQAVEDFAASFPRCRILVTSRTYAYQKQDWRLPGFAEAILAAFTAGQIRRFVDNWYAHIAVLRGLNPDDAQGRAEELKRAIFAGDRLIALAERPLLLTLMASLHAWRGGSLPEKREQLYADTVDLLLDWWESPKIVRDAQGQVVVTQPSLAEWLKVDRGKVRDLLNEIAYRAHAAQPELVGAADVSEGDLISGLMRLSQNPDVNPARLVEYLSQRAGLLLPHGIGVYTFPHRTFQEYLAACYLTDHDYPDRLAELARADPNRWREAALLAGAKAARGSAFAAWALAEALCYREPDDTQGRDVPPERLTDAWGAHLAGQALVETADLEKVSERDKAKVTRVQWWLVHILRTGELPALERARAGDTLARLGDPRPEVMTVEAMEFCFVPAGPFVMGEGKDKHTNAHLTYACWLARHPVTQAQFKAFVDAGGYAERRYWPEAEAAQFWKAGEFKGRWDDEPRTSLYKFGMPFDLPNHPVVGVTWYEALAFCRWLTEQYRAQLPAGYAFGLPSEAEWEKGARGGAQIVQKPVIRALADGLSAPGDLALAPNDHPERAYPWGDEFDPNKANMDETGVGATSAAGCFSGGASPYGIIDLSGDVWEWTRSHSGSYPYDPQDGREVLSAPPDIHRVLRGGAFNYYRRFVRCAYRNRFDPFNRLRSGGFRVVVSPF